MQYFEKFNLRREPFSFTPDPDMFYRSPSRMDCLHQLTIAIRLHRGLCAVIGGVGSGKTTLCRVLVRELAHYTGIDVCLVLNAGFAGRREFLLHLGRLLHIPENGLEGDETALAERIKADLLERFQTHNRIVCLLIDEGQTMPPECLDALEELSAVDAPDGKLLQTVIFGQNEFLGLLATRPTLEQRINYLHVLKPFSWNETRAMVATRLGASAIVGRPRPRFTWPALLYLHLKSGGFPRKIVRLCHRALIAILGEGDTVRLKHVRQSAKAQMVVTKPAASTLKLAVWACVLLLAAAFADYAAENLRPLPGWLASKTAGLDAGPQSPSEIRAKVAELSPPNAPPQAQSPPQDEPAQPAQSAPRDEPATPAASPAEPDAPAPLAQAQSAEAEPAPAVLTEPAEPTEPTEPAEPAGPAGSAAPAQSLEQAQPAPTPLEQAPAPFASAAPPAAPAPLAATAPPAAPAPLASAAAAAPLPPAPAEPPALLGQVRLKNGWVFARRQEDVYGRRNKEVFDAMAKANPGIASIFDAGPGALVNFPALAAPAPPSGVTLLCLMRAENLTEALDFIVTHATRQMPLQIFATFAPAEGQRLDVILARPFPNPEAADQAKAALPPELAAKATTRTGFAPDTVFYSTLPPDTPKTAPARYEPKPAQPEPAPQPSPARRPSPDRRPKPYVPGEIPN